MNTLVAYAKEIVGKLFSIGKLLIPGIAIFELITYLLTTVLSFVKDWFISGVNAIKLRILEQVDTLGVDLTPSSEFAAVISKINVVVPLSEMWHFFLLYLGFASVVVGVKWARNLIPGLK